MEMKFRNGSYIKSVNSSKDNARSKRAHKQIIY